MASKLDTSLHIDDPDGFYERLIELHEGLTAEESHHVNARLVLLLANQIGDRDLLDQILERARTAPLSKAD